MTATATTHAAPSPAPKKGKARGPRQRAERREAIALVIPALLPILVFSVIPLAAGVLLGFTDATLARNADISFTGIDNFVQLAGDARFWRSFGIGMVWATSVAVLTGAFALGLASLLNSSLRFKSLTRIIVLIPWAMPPVVTGILWRMIYDVNSGPLNAALGWFGLGPVNFLGDFSTALPAVIVVGIWSGLPQTTVLLLAGMQSIPAELHEAAAMDGANGFRRFWHVTLPGLRSVLIAITSIDFIWNFNDFGIIYVLTEGGPGGQTMTPPLFTYLEAFRNREIGYASAMGDVLVIAVLLILSIYIVAQFRQQKVGRS